jgi:hypothetical protein
MRLRVEDSGFRVSKLGFRVLEFLFPGSGVRLSGFGFQVTDSGFRVSGFRFRDLGLRVSGSGFGDSLGSGSRGVRVSGFLLVAHAVQERIH